MSRIGMLLLLLVGGADLVWSQESCHLYFSAKTAYKPAYKFDLTEVLLDDFHTQTPAGPGSYTLLNFETRLRSYMEPAFRFLQETEAQSHLWVEELHFKGVASEREAFEGVQKLGADRLETRPVVGEDGWYETYYWKRTVEVPIDAKTGMIDANHKIGRFIFRKLIENAQYDIGHTYVLFYLDLNHLSLINETRQGHFAGDELIIEAMGTVRKNLRTSNSGKRDMQDGGFKIGGDEYGYILKDADIHHLPHIAHRLEKEVRNNPTLIELFERPAREFANFLERLKGLGSYQELSQRADPLKLIQNSDLWISLPEALKRQIISDPNLFKKFIQQYTESEEVQLRFAKFKAVRPGISVGYKIINSSLSVKEIIQAADSDMMSRKSRQKNVDYKDLPPRTIITKSIFEPLDFD